MLRWRLRLELARILAILGPVILLLLTTRQPWLVLIAAPMLAVLAWAAIAVPRIRRIGGLLEAAAEEAASRLPPPLTARAASAEVAKP